MENKNSIIEYQRDFKDYVKHEVAADDISEANVINTPTVEEQIAVMQQNIQQLALFVGMPHTVNLNDTAMTLYPARKNGERKATKDAVSYTIDLKPFRELFAAVRFKAMVYYSHDEDIVRGIIVDDAGDVECSSDNRFALNNPWTRLPITEKSSYLVATVPLEEGNPIWIPQNIQFLPQGLAIDIAEYTDELLRDFIDVERRLSSLETCEKKKK